MSDLSDGQLLVALERRLGRSAASREAHLRQWPQDDPRPHRVTADDVAAELDLGQIVHVDPRWCDGCHRLEQPASHYRAVNKGTVAAIGRRLGDLARRGFIAKNGPLYDLTGEGYGLLADAEDAALAYLAEALS